MLTDPSTGSSQTVTTNDSGRYIFVNVKPGNYIMEISKAGFATSKASQISVKVQQATTLDASLKVGGATTVVEVTAAANELQTMNSTICNTVTGDALASVPTFGRDTSSFVTLEAGVSPDGSAAGTVVDQAVLR
jgi:carboxypeptidase family protein